MSNSVLAFLAVYSIIGIITTLKYVEDVSNTPVKIGSSRTFTPSAYAMVMGFLIDNLALRCILGLLAYYGVKYVI